MTRTLENSDLLVKPNPSLAPFLTLSSLPHPAYSPKRILSGARKRLNRGCPGHVLLNRLCETEVGILHKKLQTN